MASKRTLAVRTVSRMIAALTVIDDGEHVR
jgi:hypothetical protein